MHLVGCGYQDLGMLRTRQQLLELLELTCLGIYLGNSLEGKTCFLDATPLRARGFLDTAKLLGSRTRCLKASTIAIERLERRAACPGIHHGDMVRRIEQALVLVLTAQVHHHAHALRKLTHAGNTAIDLHAAAALGRKATLHGETLGVVRAVEQASLDARQRLALTHRRRIGALAQNELERREQRGLAGTRLTGQDG